MQTFPAAQATPTGVPTPMAATSTAAPTGGTLDAIGAITTVHLVGIAVFALLTLVAIVYGMAQRRKRRAAEGEEQARVDSLGGPVPQAEADPVAPGSGIEASATIAPPPAPADLPHQDEVAAPEPVARPAPLPTRDEPAAPAQASLTQIKGLGPKVRARLAELGVTRVDQLAALTDDEADALDAQLGVFRGRIARDRWVEQARFLAAGDVRGFEAVFGRL